MTGLPIVKIGHPALRVVCSQVPPKTMKNPKFIKFLKDMVVTMRAADGVGLAANQVGVALKAVVLECRSNKRYPNRSDFPLEIYINPRIIQYSKQTSNDWEGCLSIPHYRGIVPRARKITFEALNLKGQKVRKTLSGFHARVMQHEVDHIHGRFYVDRMPDLKSWFHLEEFDQTHKTPRK